MSNKDTVVISKKIGLFAYFAPVLFWIMALLIPSIAIREIVSELLRFQKNEFIASAKQRLMNEYQKYQIEFESDHFLHHALDTIKSGPIYHQYFSGNQKHKFLTNNHKIISKLPFYEKFTEAKLNNFLTIINKETGSSPDAYFHLSPNPDELSWKLNKPFVQLGTNEEFKAELEELYKFWLKRVKMKINVNIQYRVTKNFHLFNKTLGFMQPSENSIHGINTRFSIKANAIVFQYSLTFFDDKNQPHSLLLFFIKNKLNVRHQLKSILKKYNKSIVSHSFGKTKIEGLPKFYEEKKQICLLAPIPYDLKNLLREQTKDFGKTEPALKISIKFDQDKLQFGPNGILRTIWSIFLLCSFLIVPGVYLNRFESMKKLKFVIAASFMAGIIIPISGVIFFGISFLSNQKEYETQKIFQTMEQKLLELEKKFVLQSCRVANYQNWISKKIEKQSLKQRRQIEKTFSLKKRLTIENKLYAARPFFYYFFVSGDEYYSSGHSSNQVSTSEELKPLLIGSFNDCMLSTGGYRKLSPQKQRSIAQKVDLSNGIIEQGLDTSLFKKMFELEAIPVESKLTPRKEFFSIYFLNQEDDGPDGILALYSDSSSWIYHVGHMIDKKRISVNFVQDGYHFKIVFLPVNSVNSRNLNQMDVDKKIISLAEQSRLFKIAKAAYKTTESLKQNNLDFTVPHLLFGKKIAFNSMFAMVYAEKISSRFITEEDWLLLITILAALSSSIILSLATARVLLFSIEPFTKAIEETRKNNLLWKIDLESGDEFEMLADSFNQMSVKLIERQKISQLVSQNVLDVVSSKDERLLKPGGEKVKASVLFSDIRGFTTLSEQNSPEEIVEMLNQYFSIMASVIEAEGGIIDKLIGDAIQAVFFINNQDNPELRATRAAIEMRKQLRFINEQRKEKAKFCIENGIGISTGEVISGRVGTEKGKLDATIVGLPLKHAEKLESLSKFAKVSPILIDEETAKIIKSEKGSFELLPFTHPELNSEMSFEVVGQRNE